MRPLDGLLRLLVILIAVLVPIGASADARVPIPVGWDEVDAPHEAVLRARAWADGNGEVKSVMTPNADDDFAETLAVLELRGALDPDAASDLAIGQDAIAEAGKAILGADDAPQGFEIVPVDGGTSAIVGLWRDDALVVRLALVPTGPTHAAIVLAVPSDSAVLYADVMADALAALQGASPSVRPVARGLLNAIAWIGWIALGVAAGLVVARSGSAPGSMGRAAAAIVVGLAVVVGVIVLVAFGSRDAELALAGVSDRWFAVELAVGGLMVAIVLLVVTSIWDRRLGVVQSAPSGGAYVPRSPASAGWRTGDTAVAVPVRTGTTAVDLPARTGDTAVGPAPTAPPARTGDTVVTRRPSDRKAANDPGPLRRSSGAAGSIDFAEGEVAFPPPGRRSAVGELELELTDEPTAKLERVGVPNEDDEPASLATAEIRLDDGKRPPPLGRRFRRE